ncbi:MAG TPA: hydrogenase maturation nickel metallochaperone HypA [Vicinamibacteria bacterium]|nr:hydrogenase maturation nickel metallochaperone HypA [Vicinamibacteria bacterium]
MHEYSLVSALVDRVEKEALARNAVAVHRLSVRIGALSGVEPQLFASAFSLCQQGLLEKATLDIRRSEAAWACPECGAAIADGQALRCAACGVPAKLVGGDEILLEQIEMEVP